jgi:hypothetical protein
MEPTHKEWTILERFLKGEIGLVNGINTDTAQDKRYTSAAQALVVQAIILAMPEDDSYLLPGTLFLNDNFNTICDELFTESFASRVIGASFRRGLHRGHGSGSSVAVEMLVPDRMRALIDKHRAEDGLVHVRNAVHAQRAANKAAKQERERKHQEHLEATRRKMQAAREVADDLKKQYGEEELRRIVYLLRGDLDPQGWYTDPSSGYFPADFYTH